MPVNSQQRVQAAQAIGVLHREGTYRQVYTKMKGVLPKGLRGSILKLLDWPTSWAVLYDLSPAQISQNREAETARGVWDSTGTSYAGGANKTRMWKRLLGGYFVGQPDPMSQSNFPNWRKPSWMTDAEAAEIKEFIRTSYESFEEPADDGEVSMSSEMTDDTPPVETQPEPTPETTGSNVTRLNVVQGIYALYGSYFRRIFEVDEAGYVLQMESRFSPTRKAAESILTLEKLGFATGAISAMLDTFANRSLSITGLRQGNKRNYGAYIVVDLRGVRSSASAYQRRISKDIMAVMGGVSPSRVDRQFAPSTGRGLQTFKFSGMRRGQVVGLQVLSLNDINSVPNEDSLRDGNSKMLLKKEEAREALQTQVNAGSTAEPTGQPAYDTTQTSPDSFRFIGFQFFPEGQTYRQNGQFNISLNNFPDDGRTYSYVFYFARENEQGTYDIFRSVFGTMPPDSRIRQQRNSGDRLAQLKMAWNSSGRLSSENSIELQGLPLLDKRKLRQAFGQQEQAGLTTSGIDFPVTRSQMRGTPVAFAQIGPTPLAMIASMGQRFRRFSSQDPVEQAEPSSTENYSISTSQLKRIGEASMSDSNNIGFEFEGGHPTMRMSPLASKFTSKGISMNAEGYNHTTRPQWKLVPDASLSGVPNAFELVSPILSGQTGLQNLRDCLRVAEEVGCEIYEQGGVHVHFDNRGWDLQVRKNLLINQYLMSPWLQATQPKHRRNNRWAKPFKSLDGSYESFKRRVLEASSERDLTRVVRGDRYYEINVTNTRQPTWEWRFPQGSIEQDTNINMVRLLDKIIEVSKKGLLSSSNVTEDGMRMWMGIDLFTFWRNRIYDLSQTGTTGRPSYNHRSII